MMKGARVTYYNQHITQDLPQLVSVEDPTSCQSLGLGHSSHVPTNLNPTWLADAMHNNDRWNSQLIKIMTQIYLGLLLY